MFITVDKTYLNWFMSLCSLLRIITLISANGLGAKNNIKEPK